MLQPAGQVGAQWSKEASCQAQLPGPGRFTQRRALGFQSHQSTGRALAQPLPFTALLHFASLLYVRWEAFRRFGPSGQRQEPIQALLQGRGRENVSDNATVNLWHSRSPAALWCPWTSKTASQQATKRATSQVKTKTTEPTAQHWAQLDVSMVHGRHVDAKKLSACTCDCRAVPSSFARIGRSHPRYLALHPDEMVVTY